MAAFCLQKTRIFFFNKNTIAAIGLALVSFTALLHWGCDMQRAPKEKHCHPTSVFYPQYARGFWIEYFNGFTVVHIRDAYDTTQKIADYVMYPFGKVKPLDWRSAVDLQTPVRKCVALSTTQIGFLSLLGITDSVCGVADEARIYHQGLLSKIASGEVKSVSNSSGVNHEQIFAMQPSVVFAYSFNEGGNSSIPKLQSLGLRVMMINDYNERDPLGRAEWIKVFGCVYGLEALADSIFNLAASEYTALKSEAESQIKKPAVFCNLPFNDVWYMPGGDSYFANFIRHAGGNYLWEESKSERVLNLDYEAVYAKAASADYWLNPGEANTLNDVAAQSNRFRNFDAFVKKRIYNNNLRQTRGGGNDFWESGVVQPHLVLKDLIFIFHPNLLPGHSPVFYKPLH